jgi:hypothetical protein
MTNDNNITVKADTHHSSQSASNCSPAWAFQPFKDFGDQVVRQYELLQLSKMGIDGIRGLPRLVEVLAKNDHTRDDAAKQHRLENAQQQAELAQREVDEGFPLLHAYAALAMWSSLEASVRLFLARWLEHSKGALEVKAVQKLRVRIGEYESLKGEDRFFYILDLLEQDTAAPFRAGITRFEAILKPFGLSGAVDDEVQRDLFELNQIRNVLMHRGGRVDRRLVEACPWQGLMVGQQVIIDNHAIERYFHAVARYGDELLQRVEEYFAAELDRSSESSLGELL